MEYGIEYLRGKLAAKQPRVNLRYQYYEMKNEMRKVSALIPPEFRTLTYALGWCGKAVDTLSDRIVFDGFDNDIAKLGEIYQLNNADILHGSSVLSALISSCSFLYVGQRPDRFPTIEVIDGGNATGMIDTTTNLLTEGYAVLKRTEYGEPELEAYFLPYKTEYYRRGKLDITFTHKAQYPLLVPVIFRPDARRPFGHSRISRACMEIMQSALRTMLRSEVSAEFYSVPQKYILGLEQELVNQFKEQKGEATLSSFLAFSRDENGNIPTMGQFQTGSIAPFLDQMKMLASLFAAETGLTLDDLGFTTENPSSEEAIKASHESLRLIARRAQQTFGTGFLNAGYLAACIRDNYSYERYAFAGTTPAWMPIFEPDASALGVLGDAILKINQAADGFMGPRNIRAITGLRSDAT